MLRNLLALRRSGSRHPATATAQSVSSELSTLPVLRTAERIACSSHRLASGQLPLTRGWSAEDRTRALRGFDAACRMVGEAARRGVTIGAGTDTEDPGDLHGELALLVRCGLSPRAALRGATATAARALGRADTLGAIDVGQYADVVVLKGDPSEAIEATARIWRVVKDGRVYDPVRLRAAGR